MKNLCYLFCSLILFSFFVISCEKEDEITDSKTGTLTDSRDGKIYNTVKIGNQWWMAENLAFETNSCSFVYYNIGAKYGRLYTWEAANTACPNGWHLPTDDEWEQLALFISDENGGYSKSKDDWLYVGKHLKATNGWSKNGNGSDDYGFSALPGGSRAYTSVSNCDPKWDPESFNYIDLNGSWWSATTSSDGNAWYRVLGYNFTGFTRSQFPKGGGFSVRCVKD